MNFSDLIGKVESVPKAKRFSILDTKELNSLWSAVCGVLKESLENRKSLYLPSIGSFLCKNEKVSFVASEKVNRVLEIKGKTCRAEKINFSAVAAEFGGKRECVDAGLSDFGNALLKLLPIDDISLSFTEVGIVEFSKKANRVSFRKFKRRIVGESVNVQERPTTPAAGDNLIVRPLSQLSQSYAESKEETKKELTSVPVASNLETIEIHSTNPSPLLQQSKSDIPHLTSKLEGIINTLSKLSASEALPSTGTHSHSYTGMRLWNDQTCPICRQAAQVPTKQLSTDFSDLDFLKATIKNDSKAQQIQQQRAQEKRQIELNTAQYNRRKAANQKLDRSKPSTPLPPLVSIDKRNRKLAVNEDHAKQLQQQIHSDKQRKQDDYIQTQIQDRLNTQQFLKKFQTEETDKKLKQLQAKQAMKCALMEQVEAKKQHIEECSVYENTFARDETPVQQHQREKARQLYKEQLLLIQLKRETEKKENEQNALIRKQQEMLQQSLGKDVKEIKLKRFETRKQLQDYWSVQKKEREEKEMFYV